MKKKVRHAAVAALLVNLAIAVAVPVNAVLASPSSVTYFSVPQGWAPAVGVPSSVLSGASGGSPLVAAELAGAARVPASVAAATTFAAPMTEATLLTKGGLGVPGAVVGAYSLGTLLVNGTARTFGIDTQDIVCRNSDGIGQFAAALASGNDCASWNATHPSFIPNQDQYPLQTTPQVCSGTIPADCFQMVGSAMTIDFGIEKSISCFTSSSGWWSGMFDSPRAERWRYSTVGSMHTVKSSGNDYDIVCNQFGATYWTEGPFGQDPSFRFGFTTVDPADTNVWMSAPGATPPVGVTRTYADPSRFLQCTITGNDGFTYTDSSNVFTETSGQLPEVRCPALPVGVWANSVSLVEMGGGEEIEWLSQDSTDEFRDWAVEFPDCLTGACPLQLYKDSVSCFELGYQCDGWVDDIDQSSYACMYYGVQLDLAECFIYGPYFNEANQDSGHAYGDPATGAILTSQTSPSLEDRITDSFMSKSLVTGYGYQLAADPVERREWARAVAAQCISLATTLGFANIRDECQSMSVFSPGEDVKQAAQHDLDAIVGIGLATSHPEWVELEYVPDTENPVAPGWYVSDPNCGPYPSGSLACDEYPFRTTTEGGPGVSLRMILGTHNSLEGTRLNGFLSVCGIKAAPPGEERRYLVIPVPAPEGVVGIPSTAWCKG